MRNIMLEDIISKNLLKKVSVKLKSSIDFSNFESVRKMIISNIFFEKNDCLNLDKYLLDSSLNFRNLSLYFGYTLKDGIYSLVNRVFSLNEIPKNLNNLILQNSVSSYLVYDWSKIITKINAPLDYNYLVLCDSILGLDSNKSRNNFLQVHLYEQISAISSFVNINKINMDSPECLYRIREIMG